VKQRIEATENRTDVMRGSYKLIHLWGPTSHCYEKKMEKR